MGTKIVDGTVWWGSYSSMRSVDHFKRVWPGDRKHLEMFGCRPVFLLCSLTLYSIHFKGHIRPLQHPERLQGQLTL